MHIKFQFANLELKIFYFLYLFSAAKMYNLIFYFPVTEVLLHSNNGMFVHISENIYLWVSNTCKKWSRFCRFCEKGSQQITGTWLTCYSRKNYCLHYIHIRYTFVCVIHPPRIRKWTFRTLSFYCKEYRNMLRN